VSQPSKPIVIIARDYNDNLTQIRHNFRDELKNFFGLCVYYICLLLSDR